MGDAVVGGGTGRWASQPRRRPPVAWTGLIALVAILGIASRRYAYALPGFIAAYAGDTLWATAAYLGIGLILPRAATGRVALLAMAFSVLIEVSQLYHAPWIDSIRGTTIGGLILGFGFVWSDLACYAVGVGVGVVIERIALADPDPGSSSAPEPCRPPICQGRDPRSAQARR